MSSRTIPTEVISNKIFIIRGQKVMIDRDLAQLYNVKTKVLNQATKRNIKRFPSDFMFVLSKQEMNQLVTNCDRFNVLKHSTSQPYAFTEQGVAMLSSVLNSEQAVLVNVAIMRAFVKLRETLSLLTMSAAAAPFLMPGSPKFCLDYRFIEGYIINIPSCLINTSIPPPLVLTSPTRCIWPKALS